MDTEKNIYGLSEGVFKACQFLGLKFPSEAVNNPQPVPSDYFGDDFELDAATKKKLCSERKWSSKKLAKEYSAFTEKYFSQRCFKHTKTDLNVYFVDHMLFAKKQQVASGNDYFDFEFYNKSFELRDTFRTERHAKQTTVICNDFFARELLQNKAKTNIFFAGFLHRDWLETGSCTLEDFKAFIEKHPRFFSKPVASLQGRGAEIIAVEPNADIEKIFANLKSRKRLLEEIVIQHKDLAAFCPDTVNTIRVYSFLDIHNVVHILATSGRFGRLGGVIDNVHNGGGYSAVIDPKTGIIVSDGCNNFHERVQKHADTGKTFKGFQYPYWEKVCVVVKKMAKMLPQLRHVGWDIAVNDKGELVLIEANGNLPDVGLQQMADSVGRLSLYQPLLEEMQTYKKEEMQRLGWRVINLPNFDSVYENNPNPRDRNSRLQQAMEKLLPDCESLLDLGCRAAKPVKKFCPANVKYFPVDFKQHDAEVIACDFNEDFPDIKADTCLSVFTAEFVENLPQFLANMCNAAQKQILMWCRPFDKELNPNHRWKNPFLTDFTEEFLIKTMQQNGFELIAQYPDAKAPSVILYDFRKASLATSML